jgi:hypothetical protein
MISVPIARPAIPFGTCGAIPLVGAGVAVTALADWLFYLHQPKRSSLASKRCSRISASITRFEFSARQRGSPMCLMVYWCGT